MPTKHSIELLLDLVDLTESCLSQDTNSGETALLQSDA